jgi:hypothetical protein
MHSNRGGPGITEFELVYLLHCVGPDHFPYIDIYDVVSVGLQAFGQLASRGITLCWYSASLQRELGQVINVYIKEAIGPDTVEGEGIGIKTP